MLELRDTHIDTQRHIDTYKLHTVPNSWSRYSVAKRVSKTERVTQHTLKERAIKERERKESDGENNRRLRESKRETESHRDAEREKERAGREKEKKSD